MQDLQVINEYLARIRQANHAELRPCSLVTDAFIQNPPHAVGVAHLMLRPRMLLGDPTGTGKTPQTLVGYAYLKEKNPHLKALVSTTQSAQFQWVRATQKFLHGISAKVISYEQRPDGTFEHLSPRDRAQQWPSLMGTDIWVTTGALSVKEHANLLQGLDQFVYVVDEAQAYKSHTGEVAYPAALKLSQKARCCWGLSATPMMNDKLAELYSIMELVRPGTFGDWSGFRKTYFVLDLIKPQWKDKKTGKRARPFYKPRGYKNLDLLKSQIEPFFLKRPIGAFQQYMPPVSFKQFDVPLSTAHRGLYTDIMSKHWPVSRTPLQQLAALTYAQMVVDAPSVLGFDTPNAKLEELVRLLQEDFSGRKVIVYAKFEKVIRVISERLAKEKIRHGIIAGPVSPAQRLKAQDQFQTGTLNVMLITSAGSQALDLQASDTIIAYDLPWSWGELQQVVGRARRVGSTSPNVLFVMLCGLNTIDTIVAHRLTAKEKVIHTIIGADEGAKLSDRERVDAEQLWQAHAGNHPEVGSDFVPIPEGDLSALFREVAA